MLNIEINHDVKLTSDSAGLNVMIEERIYKKDEFEIEEPTDKFKVVGHYASVPSAVKGLIKRGLNKSDATSFDELMADMEQLKKEITESVTKAYNAHMLDSKA